ncbi:MAG: FHA domain-containing protein [Planctomycetota bacterium]|nr:MAG: FHA domain-containing protein [Planctomycetota bacterium]
MDAPSSSLPPEAIGERAVAQGIASPERIREWLEDFRSQPDEEGGNFARYLLARGAVTLRQLAALSQGLPPKSSHPEALSDPAIGTIYSGLVVEQLLGKGGMGSVYLARRAEDGEPFVVKVLAPHLAHRADLRARFQREAEVLARLPEHPGIVRVGAVQATDPRPHIVMEYVEGLSLDGVLEERWSLPTHEALRVGRDIARALSVVHEAGIIHRDLKPANVLLTPAGEVKVVDFGLAKDLFADGLTRPGQRLGTPYYMAPEQWGDHEVDARCDVFALGATLYHLLVGEPPFQASTKEEVARRIAEGDYTPPRRIEPALSEDVELVVAQMLLPERCFRYPDMRACAEDLERLLERKPPRVPCLYRLREGGARGERYALLPGRRFLVGRTPECDHLVGDASISRRHAAFRRESTGFVLRDLGSSFGTYVNEMRIRQPVGLKSGDCVRLGRVMFEFLDPVGRRLERSRRTDALRREPARDPAPDAAVESLVALGDRRTALHLVERLAAGLELYEPCLRELAEALGEETASEVRARLERAERRERTRVPMLLFALTGENLGADPAAWFSWWQGARAELPAQVVPRRPFVPLRLRVLDGQRGGGELAIGAEDGWCFSLGRDAGCDLPLDSRTVSRHHAVLHRLHRRVVLEDQGSRLGSSVNGRRVRVAFLAPGDQVTLGEVRLVLERQDEADERLERVGLGLRRVESAVFDALVELEHPAVVTGLLALEREAGRLEWAQWQAAALFPADDEQAEAFLQAVRRLYAQRVDRGRPLLERFLGCRGLRGGTQRLAERRGELGPQFLPAGWIAGEAEVRDRERG